MVNTFAQSSQYCHWFNKCLTNGSFVGFISFDDSNFWCRQNTRYYRAIHLFPSTYFKKHVYRNENVDENYRDVAKGMGMTNLQSIFSVELPIAMPTIMAGIRLAAVYVIAWATLASYIGAGGLGDMIFSGLNNYQPELIFGGTIPVTILALLADVLLGLLENRLTPKALREGE